VLRRSIQLWLVALVTVTSGCTTRGVALTTTTRSVTTSRASTTTTPRPVPARRLPDGQPVPARDLLALQMFPAADGVGIAAASAAGTPMADYLVTTSDGGERWNVKALVPFVTAVTLSDELSIAMLSVTTGWMADLNSGQVMYTGTRGDAWRSLRTRKGTNALSLQGGVLWVVASACASSCGAFLDSYRPGQVKPLYSRAIPNLVPTATPFRPPAEFLDRVSAGAGVLAEATEGGGYSALLLAGQDGRTWRRLSDPCARLVPAGLAIVGAHLWVLYCQLDGGMHQGDTAAYQSTDSGATWQLVAEGSVPLSRTSPNFGGLGDTMANSLAASSDGRVLWLLSSVDGVRYSLDAGRNWQGAAFQTGGEYATIALGPGAQAWLPVYGTGLYHTDDGVHWTMALA
jgi:hypothetical protein